MHKKKPLALCFLILVVCSMVLSITPFFVEEALAYDWCQANSMGPCAIPDGPTWPWQAIRGNPNCCCLDDYHATWCLPGW
jgi:hypothetical protein